MHDGELSYLRGFQFNNNSPLDKALKVRVEVQLDNGQINVTLPPISTKEISGPVYDQFSIRFLLVSFDFSKGVYSNIGFKEIRISSNKPSEGGRFAIEGKLPGGRRLLLSMSLHAYCLDNFEGYRPMNSGDWSPAELVGAWQTELAANEELPEPLKLLDHLAAFYSDITSGYQGNYLNSRILKLRSSASPLRPQALRPKEPPWQGVLKLPEGDIRF